MEEQMIQQITDIYSEIVKYYPVMSIVGILSTVLCVFFMHFSAQHRNHKLGLGWYVCGVLFGPWTVLVFLLKRNDFPGPDLKECPSCGNRCPVSYEVCNRCLVELPKIDTEEKAKQKKLSKILGIGVIVTCTASLLVSFAVAGKMFSSVIDIIGSFEDFYYENDRISVDGVFYDKKGNSYEDEDLVPLYDKEGRVYTYTVIKETDEEYDYEYDEFYYIRDDGEKYYEIDCYVTADGFFFCDKMEELHYYEPDPDKMTAEEIDAYYKQQMEADKAPYRYYNDYLIDKDGNVYYYAFEASWDANGELITAENDPTLTVQPTTAAKAE